MNGVKDGTANRNFGLECNLAPTELSRDVPRVGPCKSEAIRQALCAGHGAEPGEAQNHSVA